MATSVEFLRLRALRILVIVGLSCVANSSGYCQVPRDSVVWSASGAAGLRIIPKPMDAPGRAEIVPASGIEPLRLPFSTPDATLQNPPSPTATLCDQPHRVAMRPLIDFRRVEIFPTGLLWEPALAGKREARLAGLASNLSNVYTQKTVDTQIGGNFGIARLVPEGSDLEIQVDLFGVVNSRFSQYDFLIASDYRAGIPLTFRRGPWAVKVAYEHTSTHLGDELIQNTGATRIEYIKDEVVLGLSRLFDDRLRVYGQAGYAFRQFIDGNPSKYRFDVGFEWFHRAATGPWGTPFVAANVGFRGENAYNADVAVQAGWLWRHPDKRLAQWRVYGEYSSGKSYFGQLFRTRENFGAFGIALDY